MIRHIVVWKYQNGQEETMHRFLDALNALNGVIPEIRAMQTGVNCLPGGNYDACLIADFDDAEALSRYKNDPRHKAAAAICHTILENRVAVDFEV